MLAPFQKDEALLADIAAAESRGAARLWWLGQSGFLLQSAGLRLLLDPYLSDSLTRKYQHTDKPHVRMTERVIDPGALHGISLVTSSHAHTDHFDPDTLGPLLEANRDAQLLVARANHRTASERLADVAARIVSIDAGEAMNDIAVGAGKTPGGHQIDLPLASLAAAEYVIEISAKGESGSDKQMIAFRIVS